MTASTARETSPLLFALDVFLRPEVLEPPFLLEEVRVRPLPPDLLDVEPARDDFAAEPPDLDLELADA